MESEHNQHVDNDSIKNQKKYWRPNPFANGYFFEQKNK